MLIKCLWYANVREVIHSKWKQLMAIWNTHINKQMYRPRALKFWSKTHQKRTKQWFSRKHSTRKCWQMPNFEDFSYFLYWTYLNDSFCYFFVPMLRKLGKNQKVIRCYESLQLNHTRKVCVKTQVKTAANWHWKTQKVASTSKNCIEFNSQHNWMILVGEFSSMT